MAFDPESFIDTRINTNYRLGFVGGPEFNTLQKRQRSGITRRRPLQEMPKHRYRTDYVTLSDAERQHMLSALWAADGAAYSFRFRDYNDWKVENQVLGLGGGDSDPIQLFKDYQFGPRVKRRDITLPYKVTMKAAGIEFSDFTVDPLSGIASPTSVWPDGDVLSYSCRFDVCVRFANDYNPMSSVSSAINEIMIELIEERYG